jgi:hypothetical protein
MPAATVRDFEVVEDVLKLALRIADSNASIREIIALPAKHLSASCRLGCSCSSRVPFSCGLLQPHLFRTRIPKRSKSVGRLPHLLRREVSMAS